MHTTVLGELKLLENARLLADALHDDPAYAYLFPEPTLRRAGLMDFFTGHLRRHLPMRCTHVVTAEDGELLGSVTVRPPGGVRESALALVLRGLLPFALRHGRSTLQRLIWLGNTYTSLEAHASRSQPHYHVHMMAVRPSLQGRGHGSRLLATALRRSADAGAAKLPTVLTTHRPANVEFYRRAGFTLVDERRVVPPGAAAYPVWSMTRHGLHAQRGG